MAKRLILVRHAKAEYGAIQDAERSLTKTGQRQALQLGLELAQRLDRLDLMIISPAKRAQQTAEPLIGRARLAGLPASPQLLPRRCDLQRRPPAVARFDSLN